MENVQNVQNPFLSPRELAGIVGVSESSIKRWVDSGRISTTLTAGGHRRIPMTEALRFVRRERLTPKEPGRLGLVRLSPSERGGSDDPALGERLFEDLRQGRDGAAISLIQSLFLAGRDVDQIVDGPLRTALDRLGKLWLHGSEGIYHEHRATQICIRAIHRLRALQTPAVEPSLTAVGGAHSGDPYVLPSLAVATVLEARGIRAIDLGPDTPAVALQAAIREQQPDVVWISATAELSPDTLRASVARTLDDTDGVGASLVVGGRQADGVELPAHPRLFRGGSMAELSAFARGLVLAS